MANMDANDLPPRKPLPYGWQVVLTALLAVYVLSVGPVWKFIPSVVWLAYGPMFWLSEHWPWLRRVLFWYLVLWGYSVD